MTIQDNLLPDIPNSEQPLSNFYRINDVQREQEHILDSRLFDYSSLLRATRVLYTCRDIEKLTAILMAIVCDRLDNLDMWVFLFNEGQNSFELKLSNEDQISQKFMDSPEDSPFSFTLQPGILWQLLCQREPISIVGIDGNFRFKHLFETTRLCRFKASLWLPLVNENSPVGFLALGQRNNNQNYTDIELEFLRTLGELATVAISSVTLYNRLSKKQSELDRTIRNLSVLYDISRSIGQINNMKQLLAEILSKAIERVSAQKGSIMLYDPEDQVLRLQVVQGLPDKIAEARINRGEQKCKTFKSGEGVAGKVFKSGKYFLSHNTKQDEAFKDFKDSNADSIICLPLLIHDEPIGVINITNKKESKFDQEDIEILTAISQQAALTIEKADLYQLAITDELTGLNIRRFFNHRLEEELRRHKRYGTPLSLLMLDIDHFKQFNDTYGHDVGDLVLVEFAKVLTQHCRESDLLARYGGEEFVVLLPETEEVGAINAAERYRIAIAELKIPHENSFLSVSVSIGACESANAEINSTTFIRNADVALYHAKNNGRNCVVSWKEGMEHPAD